jgi:hypothetical protein
MITLETYRNMIRHQDEDFAHYVAMQCFLSQSDDSDKIRLCRAMIHIQKRLCNIDKLRLWCDLMFKVIDPPKETQ